MSGTGSRAANRISEWLPFRLQLPLIVFSLNSFIAVMLALLIGFGAGLERPYWAILTVYIVAQPLTGALRSKALFRVLGTALGGVAAVLLVPPLVNAPELLSLAMAAWVCLCLYLSLLDRTPRSYLFMLAGYTAAIIGFPSVDAPLEVFDTAVWRVEEIVVGILCATLVHSIFFPREVTAALDARVRAFLNDGRAWTIGALAGRHGARERRERRKLAAGLLTDILDPLTNRFAIGPNISWELNRSATRARIEQAEAVSRAALARFDGVVLRALRDVESAMNVYSRALARDLSVRAARDRAAQTVADTRALETAGRTGSLDTLDAERTLAATKSAVTASTAQIAADQIALFLVLGGGWETLPGR